MKRASLCSLGVLLCCATGLMTVGCGGGLSLTATTSGSSATTATFTPSSGTSSGSSSGNTSGGSGGTPTGASGGSGGAPGGTSGGSISGGTTGGTGSGGTGSSGTTSGGTGSSGSSGGTSSGGPIPTWQNLVQFYAGLSRNATKPYSLLQRTPGVWQPDILIFHDTVTGTEIWRLSNESANTEERYIEPWNTNGTFFLLGSDVNPSGQQSSPYPTTNWLYDARGRRLQQVTPYDPTRQPQWTQNSGDVAAMGEQISPWDRTRPNLFYATTFNDNNQGTWPAVRSSVYSIDITQNFLATKVADLPNPAIGKEARFGMFEDDKLFVKDVNPPLTAAGQPLYIPNIMIVDLDQQSPTYGSVIHQFSINFNITNVVGHSPANEYHFHQVTLYRDPPADHFDFNYGPEGNVGEPAFFECPSDCDASKVTVIYPNGNTPYYSHPATNYGNTEIVYGGEGSLNDNHFGVWLRDLATQTSTAELAAIPMGHANWDGYDQGVVTFDGWTNILNNQFNLYSGAIQTGSSHVLVNYPPRNRNTTPSILYWPEQSPDGTKALFTIPETFTFGAPQVTYLAVDHRPFPPVLSVSSTSPVTLTWTPYQPSHETAGYHVYRSTGASSGFQEISGLVTTTSFTDSNAAAGSTYYYAVTSEENSGLESNQLSNIMQVAAGGAATQSSPAGTTGWDTVAPLSPSNLTVQRLSAGVWKLSWNASASPDARYYDIYYSTGASPTPSQQYLIDSPPLGETEYIYWQADPTAFPIFGITAVDRQDNQSPMACIQTANPSAACP